MNAKYNKLLAGWLFLCLLAFILSIGCEKKSQQEDTPKSSRIIIKESTGVSWANINQYEIVEVDGIEYLASSHGGIIALPKR